MKLHEQNGAQCKCEIFCKLVLGTLGRTEGNGVDDRFQLLSARVAWEKKKGYQSNKKPNNFDQATGPLAMGLLSLFFGLFSLTRFIVATFGYVREDRYFRFMALKNFWV